MNSKRKNVIIVFLFLATVILTILLILSTNNNSKNNTKNNVKTEQIEVLNSQLQEYQKNDDNRITEKENVCTNFLKTYYSVQHNTSKTASLPECKKYLTEQLYNELSPDEKGTEYAQKDIDIDYTSSISIKDTYLNCTDSDKLIIRCTIKRTVNGMQSVNEYFVSFRVENIDDEWLVSKFELISVQGG